MITPELIAKFRIALDYIDALGLHGRHVGDLINHAPALLDEIERLRARVAELETEVESSRKAARTCHWDQNGPYYTGCGHLWEFTEGDIEDNDAKYCQYCGGKIVEDAK